VNAQDVWSIGLLMKLAMKLAMKLFVDAGIFFVWRLGSTGCGGGTDVIGWRLIYGTSFKLQTDKHAIYLEE
jgi:hypothetical protein